MKARNILLIIVIGLSTINLAQAQFKAYQFQNRANGQYLSVADDKSGISLQEKTAENRLNQYFILKRLSNGNTLIATAQNPNLFLKNDGTFETVAEGANTSAFEWQIELAASDSGPANDQVYGVLIAVNKASNPLLGTAAGGNATQFYPMPNDIYNQTSERVCFAITARTKMF